MTVATNGILEGRETQKETERQSDSRSERGRDRERQREIPVTAEVLVKTKGLGQ